MDIFDQTLTIKSESNSPNETDPKLEEETKIIKIRNHYQNTDNKPNLISIQKPIHVINSGILKNTNNVKNTITIKKISPSICPVSNPNNTKPVISIKSTNGKPLHSIVKIVPVTDSSINERKRQPFTYNIPALKKIKIESNTENSSSIKQDIKPQLNNRSPIVQINQPNKQNSNLLKDFGFENTEFGELKYSEAYADYQSSKLKLGNSHPYVVVESKSLSTVEAPGIRYQLKMPKSIITKGILSNVQIEAIVYACQRHEEYLGDGKRAGFLIGDGAGVGKGRTVSGIIYENYLVGRKKALWISVSNDLKEDAKRDLKDIGKEINVDIKIRSLNKMSYLKVDSKENGKFSEGVLFVTYSSLISNCKKMVKKCFKSRFDQIVKWFGKNYDGVIVLDECHKAKNLHHGVKTKTGTLVKKLQDTLKEARVVYASATGASEPKHMAYMVRLGLWGPGKPFKRFDEFENTLTKHGVGAMELIAMEMKGKGMYLARQLSFENVKFEIKETTYKDCTINGHKFEDVYNKSVDLWNQIFQEFKRTYDKNKSQFENDDNMFQAQFWSAHQRFFKYLCISAKIQDCVQIAMDKIKEGKCIVIGLQSTGESSLSNALEENYGEMFDFVSNAKSVIKNLIKNHFPSIKNLKKIQENRILKNISCSGKSEAKEKKSTKEQNSNKGKNKNQKYDSDEDSENSSDYSDSEIDEYVKDMDFPGISEINIEDDEDIFSDDYISQKNLLQKVDEMSDMFPTNVLDQLIQEFGGPEFVAELTGRKGRMVEVDGKITYQTRKEGEVGLDQINLLEKDRFNNGQKIVAIISDAASTGISLHSDKRFNNQYERFHITLELPWSADKAIQQFGRTHRSNQLTPPHYLFLISDLAGERRFAATVAKRLESLGALTHGDRRCADTKDLSQFNFDTEFGAKAVKILINTVFNIRIPVIPYPENHMKNFENSIEKFKNSAIKALQSVGLEQNKTLTVTKFLNRLLGIELNMQNALFQYFLDIIDVETNRAKLCNQFDHGIRDLMNDSDNIFKDEPEVITMNENDHIKIHKVTNIYLGVNWKTAEEMYFKNPNENMFCYYENQSLKFLGLAVYENEDKFKLITPNFPEKIMDRRSLFSIYSKLDYLKAKSNWEYVHSESEHKCHHLICKQTCIFQNSCTLGKRTKTHYIMTGAIFLAWKRISGVYPSVKMEVVRVQLYDKSKLIGALISPRWYKNVKDVLSKDLK